MTAPTITNPDQRTILTRFARGDGIDQIVNTTDLGRDRVTDLITTIAGFDRGRARAAVLAYDAGQKALSSQPGAINGTPTIEDLLTTAEKSGVRKAERLAARVRRDVGQLEGVLRDSEEERVLRATRDVLARHITKIDQDLKQLKNGAKPSPRNKTATVNGTAPAGTATPKAVRAWCRASGIECPGMGVIPKDIRARYEQAQAAS